MLIDNPFPLYWVIASRSHLKQALAIFGVLFGQSRPSLHIPVYIVLDIKENTGGVIQKLLFMSGLRLLTFFKHYNGSESRTRRY